MTYLDRMLMPIATLAWLALTTALPYVALGVEVSDEAELRQALEDKALDITFAPLVTKITLTENLPLIFHTVTIDGGNNTIIDGGKTGTAGSGFRVFFAGGGSELTLLDITIANGAARGGAGAGSGGGGLGAGGALFVDSAGSATLTNVTFTDNDAFGGSRGGGASGGGGGGLGGNGGLRGGGGGGFHLGSDGGDGFLDGGGGGGGDNAQSPGGDR